jgi:anti-anti-sigma regulatory factor
LVDDDQGPSTPPGRVVVCDMGELDTPDLTTVESLALLRIGLQALGYALRLRDVPPRLRQLLELCGLAELLTEPYAS